MKHNCSQEYEYATLLLAMHSLIFQYNYESINTLGKLASSSDSDLAQYIHGIALLSLGELGLRRSMLSILSKNLQEQPQGWYTWKKCRYQTIELLSIGNFYNVPQSMVFSIGGSSHLNRIDVK